MFFTRPTSDLKYEDIAGLTSSGEPESIILDYKKMVSGSGREKAELAKDICAFANSQGGYLVIGVEEQRGKPVHPPCGTERMLERQKAEEWIEQVINSNIAQRVNTDIKVIAIPESDDLCIIVVHVPMSIRMPHMVTGERDNRYYRRIFKRHQFESLPAEEYEVREMFEKGSRMFDTVKEYLSSQGYVDPSSDSFADNAYTENLGMLIRHGMENREMVQARHFVSFVACPDILTDDIIDTSKDELWHWLDPNIRRYQPAPGMIFLPLVKTTTLDGIILAENNYRIGDSDTGYREFFIRINRNGFIELGCNLASQEEDEIGFAFVPMIGLFWQYLCFVNDLYTLGSMHMPFKIILNMKGTKGALLHNLGVGWIEPRRQGRSYRPTCNIPNVQIIKEFRSATIDAGDIAKVVREVATRVDNAWGQREARCYNDVKHDPHKQFPIGQMRR